MRINNLRPSKQVRRAREEDRDDHAVGRQRPAARRLVRRGGAREGPGEDGHRFAWHDRKAWWQQEQAILAYLILTGILGDEEYRTRGPRLGGVLQRVLPRPRRGRRLLQRARERHAVPARHRAPQGQPLDGGYHTIELCYLAAVYTNLLITKQPLDLYFKPSPTR